MFAHAFSLATMRTAVQRHCSPTHRGLCSLSPTLERNAALRAGGSLFIEVKEGRAFVNGRVTAGSSQ